MLTNSHTSYKINRIRYYFKSRELKQHIVNANRQLPSTFLCQAGSMLTPLPDPIPPPHLDRNSFTTTIDVPALRVPKQKCNELMRKFKGCEGQRRRLACMSCHFHALSASFSRLIWTQLHALIKAASSCQQVHSGPPQVALHCRGCGQ